MKRITKKIFTLLLIFTMIFSLGKWEIFASEISDAQNKKNSLEKKKLMNDLFGGSSSSTQEEKPPQKTFTQPAKTNIPSSSMNKQGGGGLFGGMKINKGSSTSSQPQPQQQPQTSSINLLGLDEVKPVTDTNTQPSTQPIQTIDLLNDIFGNQPSQPAQPTQPKNTNLLLCILQKLLLFQLPFFLTVKNLEMV